MVFSCSKITSLPTPEQALPGREHAMQVPNEHFVNGHAIQPPFPQGMHRALFGMGCFWGAERRFWRTPGVHVTAVGYAGGYTPNPTYREVCTGMSGHNEVVLVVFHPRDISYARLLKLFWEGHDPTQGMRQGHDVGTQYRSGIYVFNADQRALAEASKQAFSQELTARGLGPVTTQIVDAPRFYYAEESHQQYLAKNPNGYCGLGGLDVSCPPISE